MPEVSIDDGVIALDEESGEFHINKHGVVLTMLQAEQVASMLLNWAAKGRTMPEPEPEPGPKKH